MNIRNLWKTMLKSGIIRNKKGVELTCQNG